MLELRSNIRVYRQGLKRFLFKWQKFFFGLKALIKMVFICKFVLYSAISAKFENSDTNLISWVCSDDEMRTLEEDDDRCRRNTIISEVKLRN